MNLGLQEKIRKYILKNSREAWVLFYFSSSRAAGTLSLLPLGFISPSRTVSPLTPQPPLPSIVVSPCPSNAQPFVFVRSSSSLSLQPAAVSHPSAATASPGDLPPWVWFLCCHPPPVRIIFAGYNFFFFAVLLES